jgi:hypothetical protein
LCLRILSSRSLMLLLVGVVNWEVEAMGLWLRVTCFKLSQRRFRKEEKVSFGRWK